MYENYGKTRRSYGRSNGGKFRKKVDVKKIVIAVAAILLMVALVAGTISLFSTKTKTIHPSFSVGALDSTDGKYVEVTSSIYTKNAFECTGLIVKVAIGEKWMDIKILGMCLVKPEILINGRNLRQMIP